MNKKQKQLNKHHKDIIKKAKGAIDAYSDDKKKQTIIQINPEYKLPPTYQNQVAMYEGKNRMFKTVYEKQLEKDLVYELSESERTKLELCANILHEPYSYLEEIYLEDVDIGFESILELTEDEQTYNKLEKVVFFEQGNIAFLKGNGGNIVKLSDKKPERPQPQQPVKKWKVTIVHDPVRGIGAHHTVFTTTPDQAIEVAKQRHIDAFGKSTSKNLQIVSAKEVRRQPHPYKSKKKKGILNKLIPSADDIPNLSPPDVQIISKRNPSEKKKRGKLEKFVRGVRRAKIGMFDEPVSQNPYFDARGETGQSGEPALRKRKRTRKPKVVVPASNDNDAEETNES